MCQTCVYSYIFVQSIYIIYSSYLHEVYCMNDRALWEELQNLSKDRKEKLRKSEECHKFYKDLTDALGQIKVSVQLCNKVMLLNNMINITALLVTCHLSCTRRGTKAFLMT